MEAKKGQYVVTHRDGVRYVCKVKAIRNLGKASGKVLQVRMYKRIGKYLFLHETDVLVRPENCTSCKYRQKRYWDAVAEHKRKKTKRSKPIFNGSIFDRNIY